ncbi:MAG TPA: prolyl oligopeptidase family serine peptidase [Saprospiraceae bacterium]|nr:prolyl oligopeptidase family serine peptidase [Saprospiraceae bacterium]
MQLNLSCALAGLLILSVMNSCKNTSMKDTVSDQSSMKPLVYPETRKDTVWDDFFGNRIDDPFRWLEDDHSEETKAWVKVQNELTFGYLDQIPFRKELRARIEKWFDYEKCGTPIKKAGRYYYFKNNGLQNQDVLYVASGLKDSARMVIDPNTFSKDGTTSLSGFSFSKDGRYMAFQTSEGGSDWNKINVLDLTTGNTLNDTIRWVKFSGTAWESDGFYYSRYPEPKGGASSLSAKNEFHSVYYHKLGTDQSRDKLIYRDAKNPLRNAGTSITEDQRFLLLTTMESTSGNGLAVKDLRKPASGFHWLVSAFDSDYSVIGNSGDSIFIHTNHESPNWKVFAVDMKNPRREHWRDVIPEGKDVLQSVNLLGGKLVCTYMENASSVVRIFDLKGDLLHTLALPELGTVGGFSGEANDAEAFYSFSSFIRPNTIYRLDLNSFQSELFFSPSIEGYRPELYTTSQVWFTSKDGTRVPMFLTHKKDLVKGGKAPTLLYAYGGFDISLLPSFSVTRLPILENNGIFAVANLRGGGEFGKEWHMAGTKERKQNVFDDFAAAADFLVAEKYTDRDHLAIQGGSNGGLLIGATITQKPDICKVAFPAVGVLDMLRYHKFTIGWAWASDYGTSETKEGFDYLIKYSPLHQAKPAAYPATLITTADHDDRVVPAHSFKFAAAMQQAQKGANPMLIRIDVSAGHGAGKPTSKRIDEAADVMGFMFYNMGITPDLK